MLWIGCRIFWRYYNETVTICGSMRFANEMKSIAYYLETQQKFNVLQCVYLPDNVVPTDEDIKVLEVAHYRKLI